MKKRMQIAVVAALLLMLVGCGSKKLEAGNAVGEAGSGVTAGSAADMDEAANNTSLDVENDAFTFEALTAQVGAKEADVLALIGAKDKADSYNATLFGEPTVIVLTSDKDTVSSIQLTFADTEEELLSNAISEQLAQDGENAENTTKWTYNSSTVTLSKSDKGCVVEITKK